MSRFVTNNLQTTTNKENELSDIDTSKLHYVKVPENHIVIDFDKSGAGNRLHYVVKKTIGETEHQKIIVYTLM